MRCSWLVSCVIGVLATSAAAEPASDGRASITIANDNGWPHQARETIAVRIANGPWRKVKKGKVAGPFKVAVGAAGAAIAFDVQTAAGRKSFRRWAALLPGTRYRVVGNPCAHWGLEVDDDAAEGDVRVRIDVSQLPAALFPLVFTTDLMTEADEMPDVASDTTIIVEKPGVSAPLALQVSAMCAHSGGSIKVWSRATNKLVLDETLIGHPGRLHTVRLAKRGGFTLAIGGS